MLVFDIETDGFIENVTQIHCLVILDTETGTYTRYNDVGFADPIEVGLQRLADADELCGHNVLKYDLPVIRKLYPKWETKARVVDTLILTRLAFPELGAMDDKLIRLCKMPGKYRDAHKLEAWGFRLGVLKGEYDGDPSIEDLKLREATKWDAWNASMEDYCAQDVKVTEVLLTRMLRENTSPEAVALEHATTVIISRQELNGFPFDTEAAHALLATLQKERVALEDDLKARFGFWFARDGKVDFVPKKDNKKQGYTQGAALTKVKAVYFNPGSRHHIARVLTRYFGWKPTTFTPTGEPEVNEESLKVVHHPEATTLLRYLMVQKRLGQLAEGKQAWLNYVRDGRIHGNVNVLGTVTGRMSHSNPNLGQVPAVRSPFGVECRGLFHARKGWSLVGADADALELRVLAHFMAKFDGGDYVKVVLEGNKKLGTDMHSVNARAIGLDPTKVYRNSETGRDIAKTWFYAMIYGGGGEKLGMIITGERNKAKNIRIGRRSKNALIKNLPAMGKLLKAISDKGGKGGFLKGLDGRKLFVRSAHSAPNTLFQSAGAVVMKKALVILDNGLQAKGLTPGVNYEFCGNIHDEWQIECAPQVADTVGELAVEAIREAGVHFKFRCPLGGNFVVGRTWADTH